MKYKRIVLLLISAILFANAPITLFAAENNTTGKVASNGMRSSVLMDHSSSNGSISRSGGFYDIKSWAKSWSDVKNDTINTKNYLVVNGYQQDSATKTITNGTTCETAKTICSISQYTSAYTHSSHLFKLKGYKDNTMNTSKTL